MNRVVARLGTAGELVAFIWRRKRYWLLPVVLILVAFGFMIALAQTSPLAPLLYTVF